MGWEIKFAHTQDKITQKIVQGHFTDLDVRVDSLPNTNVEVFNGRTPGPPRSTYNRKPELDGDYLTMALQFFDFAAKLSARWVVWETNPSFLRANRGKHFAQVLTKLGQLGYGFAYRVLDAKYFGVPQNRRTLYLIGYRGDWRPPASVLFERCTSTEYSQKARQKSNIVRTIKELAEEAYLCLPYKVTKTNLLRVSPRIPYLKDMDVLYRQHNPFVLISPTTGEVRHFTPIEVERLQGFMDNYTEKIVGQVQPLGKKARYALIGNAGCVPVYVWIYWRMNQIQSILNEN